ncbi:hypothetical protein EJ995_06160 [Nonlabens ponticola]|uniref:Uncharacterized protein n=1 Tax=Nonlabens ponticola TaxID=2496866 RepID=A0A3S9N1A1_9FLAO|nr:hypothetical protein EJ995_06160 [Nonlabens ponticola]
MATAVIGFTSCDDDDDLEEGRFDRAELYVTSVANGDVTVYDFEDRDDVDVTTLTNNSDSNEGIIYDASRNELFVASRSNQTLSAYTGIEDLIDGGVSGVSGVESDDDLESPRAIARNGRFIVVADNDGDGDNSDDLSDDDDDNDDDDGNELFVYERTSNGLELRDRFEVDFALWGIEFIGDDLYAVVDQTNQIAVFEDFLNNTEDDDDDDDDDLDADKVVSIENLTRTHGIAYDNTDDVMILTDIGAASSDNDGGLILIQNFQDIFDATPEGGTIATGAQTRVYGSNTFLGNPIDVDYDTETNSVLVAEVANGGGRVLGFNNIGNGGNIAPTINNLLPGASSVDFYLED